MHPNLSTDLAQQAGQTRTRRGLLIGAAVTLALAVIALIWPLLYPGQESSAFSAQLLTATPSPFQPSGTPVPASDTPLPPVAQAQATDATGVFSGAIIMSVAEQGRAQLFWHRLSGEPYTRLTSGAWDDIDPAASPNNDWLAFASNRAGAWDLYLLELATGQTTQLSEDAAYDGAPSWSGDGSWLAYEHLDGENLEIYMRPMDGSVDPIPLTLHPGLDYAPAWRPGSQELAFVSTRSGQALIWLLDLEAESDQRFRPVSPSDHIQASPAWSPDGSKLAWAQLDADGIWRIYAGTYEDTGIAPRLIGVGEEPQWSPDGSIILATVRDANETYLTAYTAAGGLALPPQALPGRFEGMAWASAPLAEPLPAPLNAAAQATPQAAWVAALAQANHPGDPASLGDVDAPTEELSEVAIPSFAALRERTAQLLGWDALSVLGNAYVPIRQPLAPARQQDWLYTGRAFELHSGLLDAGWMVVVREEHEGQTFWRVFLRAADQAGGLGRPLTAAPWDFAARISGNEADFQAGGALDAAPGGYWLDFTALAADYGFERVPALANWRSYYPGSLHNLFVLRAGLSWEEAMLQLYSPEELATVQAATP